MHWLIVILAAPMFVELLLRLPVARTGGALAEVAAKTLRVLRSRRISDHWKERVLPRYALGLAGSSLALFFLLLVAAAPLASLAILFQALGVPAWDLLLSLPGLVACTVSGSLYGLARRRWLPAAHAR